MAHTVILKNDNVLRERDADGPALLKGLLGSTGAK